MQFNYTTVVNEYNVHSDIKKLKIYESPLRYYKHHITLFDLTMEKDN